MKLQRLFTFCTGALAIASVSGLQAHSGTHVHVTNWNVENTAGAESIRINWSGPAAYEVIEFPAAEYVLIKIANAHLDDNVPTILASESPSFLKDLRLQEVSLPDGSTAVQLRLSLNEWQKLNAVASIDSLTIQSSNAKTGNPGIVNLNNRDIEAFKSGVKYGSSNAPSGGAGQSSSTSTPSPFYIPPDLTAAERDTTLLDDDFGLSSTEALFDRTVNLDFKDAELENVIRSIANKLKLNLILMPGDISGTVTVSLNNVRLGDAFDSMLKSNGLAYKIEKGGIVRIVPRSEVQSSEKETVTQTISINWVDSAELTNILKPFVSENGSVTNHAQSNTLIVEDVPENVADIQAVVQRLDVPEKQVRMETRLIDMSEAAFRGLGFQMNANSQGVITGNPVDGGGNVDTETSVVRSEAVGTVGGFIARGSGLDVTALDDFSFLGNRYSLEARLTAAETKGEALTLAAPTIVSLNNVTSLVEIKRQLPYIDATNTTQGSVATVRFIDIGTRVEITPRITNNGYVVMDIVPEQKIQVGTDATTQVPIVDERFYESSVIAKDEQTIVVGGLRQFEGNTSESGVPWIFRAPVIGWFFKTNTVNQNHVELFLFVTPSIIKDPEPSSYERSIYDKIDYNWDLPDFYFDSTEYRKAPGEEPHPDVKNELLDR